MIHDPYLREYKYDITNIAVWCFLIPIYCISFWVGIIVLAQHIAASW